MIPMESMYDDKASKTILIVDDDAVNRAILRKIFSEFYTVQEAGDGYAR